MADPLREKDGPGRESRRGEAAQTAGEVQRPCRQWTGPLPQVASEDIIAIGNGRYAHFRRDRRFAQVQVAFTAPEGVNPNPGRELTDQFKEQGWTWRDKEAGKPWIYQLEKPTRDDPTARGDSRDVLHDQFVDIMEEYRQKQGLPPTSGWRNLLAHDPEGVSGGREIPPEAATSFPGRVLSGLPLHLAPL